ncbi:hypothetical protein TEA_025301 [Camellia sinensis var. sinensis]|uniref:Uncharacterized GPI-anchored protein At5g19230-like domain-containing protein n=1 Tax=Camellia sinensis var. sinensis TaxID=542762 RepID=A0A4S4D0V3_CAMSN|nr:hypothetical protein TEA_025301 [Camellia sinensis var. sinensis]
MVSSLTVGLDIQKQAQWFHLFSFLSSCLCFLFLLSNPVYSDAMQRVRHRCQTQNIVHRSSAQTTERHHDSRGVHMTVVVNNLDSHGRYHDSRGRQALSGHNLLQGINNYRQSLNRPPLTKNDKADCLADEIADQLEDQPCTTTITTTTSPSNHVRCPNR